MTMYAYGVVMKATTLSVHVPSYVVLGIPKRDDAPPTPQNSLSPMGDACMRMDLTSHYKHDGGTNELSFQEWTQQMRDMLEARKCWDLALRDKDFKAAIDWYYHGNLDKNSKNAGYVLLMFCNLYDGKSRKEFEGKLIERFGSLVKMPLLKLDS